MPPKANTIGPAEILGAKHRSFWLDLRILLMTAWKVLRREGINQPGRATTDLFKGNGD